MSTELTTFAPEQIMTRRATIKADFADRLRSAIERKGWTMSETARRAALFLEDGDKFGRAHVWHYVQGKALPRVKYLEALSLALEVRPDELIPSDVAVSASSAPNADRASTPVLAGAPHVSSESADGMVHVRDYGDGTALLEVSHRVPWDIAITVLRMLKAQEA